VIAGLSAVVLAAGAGTAWWTWRSLRPPVTAQSPVAQSPIQSPIQSPVSQAPIQQSVQVYWIKNAGNRLELVPAAVAANVPGQPDQLVKAALEAMLKGASAPDLTSTVPQGTSLRQVEIKSDGVHVDLSREFTSGGGSTSMIGRVGQVIYTATTLDPNAPVWISVAGQPLSTLGGEGLILDQPMTRKTFNQNFQL
jgi:spore germination protein GerM